MKKNILAMKLAAAGALLAVAGSASAALPEAVTAKLTEAGTDAAVLGGAVLLVIVGIAAFKLMRKAA